jgi:hypothetical protein
MLGSEPPRNPFPNWNLVHFKDIGNVLATLMLKTDAMSHLKNKMRPGEWATK